MEKEADKLGFRFLVNSGVNPGGMVSFLELGVR